MYSLSLQDIVDGSIHHIISGSGFRTCAGRGLADGSKKDNDKKTAERIRKLWTDEGRGGANAETIQQLK